MRTLRTTNAQLSRAQSYLVALFASAAAFAASYAAWPYLHSTPWAIFFIAVMVSCWFGGEGPSLLATALIAVLSQFFFAERLPGGIGIIATGVFVTVSLFITLLTAARRRAEAYERAERNRFQATVASIGDAVIATNGVGTVTLMNTVAEQLTGWSAADAVGKQLEQIFVIVDEATRTQLPTPVALALQTGELQPAAAHTMLIAKNKTARPIEHSAAPIKDEQGRVLGVVLLFRDVKEKNDILKRLRESEEFNRRVAASSPDCLKVLDLDGRLVSMNDFGCKLMEIDDANLCLHREWIEFWPKETQTKVREALSKAWQGEVSTFEGFAPTMKGNGKWWEVTVSPVLNDKGSPIQFLCVSRDISEHKRQEEARERRAKQLQLLAEISTRINSARDVDSVIRVVRDEVRNLIGARQAEVNLPTEHLPVELSETSVSEALQSNRPLGAAPLEPSNSGWLSTPIVGRGGKQIGFLRLSDKIDGDFSDDDEAILVQLSRLTAIAVENANLYQELRTNDRRKDEFLAMLAHELRNPLAAISNAVLVSSRGDSVEHVQWANDVISRQTRHLTRIIDDLLDVSRINRGTIELKPSPVELSHLLDSALDPVRALLAQREQTLETDIQRSPLRANVDPTRIEQVVVNLLNNASKYTPQGGRITLSAHLDNDAILISVRDTGMGISEAELPHIFELFAQGDRSLARSEGGLGIGLTVVKKLVEMHGGTITAASDGLGKGSEFVVRLAAMDTPPAAVVDAIVN